jgi:hypothetical protein
MCGFIAFTEIRFRLDNPPRQHGTRRVAYQQFSEQRPRYPPRIAIEKFLRQPVHSGERIHALPIPGRKKFAALSFFYLEKSS